MSGKGSFDGDGFARGWSGANVWGGNDWGTVGSGMVSGVVVGRTLVCNMALSKGTCGKSVGRSGSGGMWGPVVVERFMMMIMIIW